MTSRFSSTGRPVRRSLYDFELSGLPDWSTSRNSSVAVLPSRRMTSLASWMPGSCTAIRLLPWRCTLASDTPSAFTRLLSAVMFCWIAKSCRSLSCLSESVARIVAAPPDSPPAVSVTFGSTASSAAFARVVLDAALAQLQPVVALEPLQHLAHGAIGVDLVDEVDAAAQVEAEAHRLQADGAHPVGGLRGEGRCDRVGAGRRGLDRVARLQLRRHVGEAQDDPALLHEGGIGPDLLLRQRVGEWLHRVAAGEGLAVLARQLQRRRLAEHVRQRQQHGEGHHAREQQALPERVTIHADVLSALRRSCTCPSASAARRAAGGSAA